MAKYKVYKFCSSDCGKCTDEIVSERLSGYGAEGWEVKDIFYKSGGSDLLHDHYCVLLEKTEETPEEPPAV